MTKEQIAKLKEQHGFDIKKAIVEKTIKEARFILMDELKPETNLRENIALANRKLDEAIELWENL